MEAGAENKGDGKGRLALFAVANLPEFEQAEMFDLLRRFQGARRSALRSVALSPESKKLISLVDGSIGEALEEEAVVKLSKEDQEKLLTAVFDYSRKLALSAVGYFKRRLNKNELKQLLSLSQIPCHRGEWNEVDGVTKLSRSGCKSGACHGVAVCNYWREATDGLLSGLSLSTTFSRQENVHYGSKKCVDVLFPQSRPELKWLPPSKELLERFSNLSGDLEELGISIEVLGVSENAVGYRLKAKPGVPCGNERTDLEKRAHELIRKSFPDLKFIDGTPGSVFERLDDVETSTNSEQVKAQEGKKKWNTIIE